MIEASCNLSQYGPSEVTVIEDVLSRFSRRSVVLQTIFGQAKATASGNCLRRILNGNLVSGGVTNILGINTF
ncbi:unnamed protein product [Brassica rapa]|uniref:Uncharacterized protein n=1 Tax=Brassica campestris TaxID=3711 RepID=A0A8D9H9X0_BRACM|nr:unnamed protein product [Brassica rapa]